MKKINKEEHFFAFLNRVIPLLTEKGVKKLRSSTIAGAGCGGAGGAAAVTLARMGAGNFKLADPFPFDPPDINRQWAANISNLGVNKTVGYEKMLLDINPGIRIKKYTEGVTEDNVEDFLSGADIAIDCIDIAVSGSVRSKFHSAARNMGICSMLAPILSFGSILCCAKSDSEPMDQVVAVMDKASVGTHFPESFRKAFTPEHLDIIEERLHTHHIPSLPISVMIAGSMLATEGLLALLGDIIPGARQPVCLPKIIVADFFKLTFQVVDMSHLAF